MPIAGIVTQCQGWKTSGPVALGRTSMPQVSLQIAAICSDTWGIEVRPNDTGPDVFQPWHWVTIPAIGIVHGEIFYLKELAEDCAADGVYEFFFCAPPLVITRGTGSPINPQAIK